jgi:glycosyltransferase involved in cell wall biosynthesis
MRIAYLADPTSGGGFYRGIAPMTALAHCHGHEVVRCFTGDARPAAVRLAGADLLAIHRYVDDRVQRLVQEAKAAGLAVVWDNDDDMGAMPRSSVTYKHFGGMAWERRLAQMRKVFRHVDLVTTPSRVLSQRMLDYGAPRADVIENYIPDQLVHATRRPHEGLTVGWVAGLEHRIDADQLPIRDALQRLLDERPDLRVVTVGLGLGLRSDRYEHVSTVPQTQLAEHAATFDVAIAPLADIEFNRSRSNVKLKEYAAGGAPWLASPIGPYAAMGEREGGRLVSDDGWYEAIGRLLDHPRERRKLGKRAAKWAAEQVITRNARRWEAAFGEAIEHARAGAPARARSSH